MSHTAPYMEDAEDRIRFSHRHIVTATAYPRTGDPIPLDVESGTLTFDESWSPRIQASLVCLLPGDQSTLDRLDSRKSFRVRIEAGYEWDSVTEDVQLLADLHVRSREVKRPENRLVLRLASDESLSQDYKRLSWEAQPPQTNLRDAVQFHADKARTGLGPAVVISDLPVGAGASAVAGMTQAPGQDSWSLLADAANRAAAQVFVDSEAQWRIAPPPVLSAVTSLNLTTGGGGIISDATASLDREEFHNAVCLKYVWKDGAGVEQTVYGNAYVMDGDFAVSTIGYNTYYEERAVPATQVQADDAARSALAALGRRGASYTMTAVAAYWLRPGQTVTATLPDAEQDRVLVSAVTFNIGSGQMTVRLRRPEALNISSTQ